MKIGSILVSMLIVLSVGICSATNQSEDKILEEINDSNPVTKILAFASIVDMGDDGLDLMAQALKSDDQDFKISAFIWMDIIEMDNPKSVEPLIESLSNGDDNTRAIAALSLGWKRDPEAVDALIKSMENDNNNTIRLYSALALGWIRDPIAVDPLINDLQDGDDDARSACAIALGWIKDSRAVDPLIGSLQDENENVRLCSAFALGWIRDPSAVDPLINGLRMVMMM